MPYKKFDGCAPKQDPHVSLNFLTDIVQFTSRIIRLVINILYVYRFITTINGLRLNAQTGEQDEGDGKPKIRPPYMCATRHHLSVEPDVVELHKELRKLMYRFKHEIRFISHTTQHYPHLLFQTGPLLESSIGRLQCSLDDLEMAATFDGKAEMQPHMPCYTKSTVRTDVEKKKLYNKRHGYNSNRTKSSIKNNKMPSADSSYKMLPRNEMDSPALKKSSKQIPENPRKVTKKPVSIIIEDDSQSNRTSQTSLRRSTRESGKPRRIEADEEQVYIIARNIHLALHTLLINAKLVHLTTKNGFKAGISTLLFPFIYDMGKKFCLSFYYLQLLSKYISFKAVQTQNRPVPLLTDFHVNLYPANRHAIIKANQFLVDNFARTVKKRSVRFNVAAQQCLPPSILTRRFSDIQNPLQQSSYSRRRPLTSEYDDRENSGTD